MLAYLLRRLLLVIPTFLGITLVIFAITRFVPGGPVERMLAQSQFMQEGTNQSQSFQDNSSLDEYQLEELNAFYGLDKPVMDAYWEWLNRLLVLDFGESTRYYEPVLGMIAERLPVSMFYGGMTFLIAYLVSIPLGYYKAVKHNTAFDNASSVLIFVGYALPGYVVGILLLSVFSFHLDWFPMGGFTSDGFDDLDTKGAMIKDVLWHAVLPLICYVIGDFATLTITMKNNLMENLSADYIRTAIAKGLPFKDAVRKHAMQNSLIPLASHFGNSLLFFLTGSFLIEVVFNIDGIGLLGYEAIMERDYPVVMAIVALNAALLLVGNIVSDICVALVDPRVRFGE
ncbi:ABC transporter permease subunit [Grimontia hollisae]|uniref:Inner membrane ABC transporter permease protein yejB n=1 Tax=Grimontia hollisae TaxID=673 RepID=A0A377HPD1_GRIHO|nr:ABC transporter permease subunit [Grimontia hollisae]MDF2185698.1 ABC transporter permease subunit [Grimontia hollisae]STO58078.1 Inner membrane ABC transporter permease protein yejB [Grimontia hollisae]STQ76589.1 Inner membrane ABC transporter permease protein yejB [Grimontia hollisae]